jgi:hypothetical protein
MNVQRNDGRRSQGGMSKAEKSAISDYWTETAQGHRPPKGFDRETVWIV